MNSLTSRPLSPISAITLISALVFLANIPSNVDFPTPDPAKMPIRWPFPRVISPSTAFTPSGSGSVIISLESGSGEGASILYVSVPMYSLPSIGLPSPSNVRPSISSPTETESGYPMFSTIQPEPIPSVVSKGIRSVFPSLKPITSAMINLFSSLSTIIRHKSSSLASGPLLSIVSPTTLTTFPSRLKYVFCFTASYL